MQFPILSLSFFFSACLPLFPSHPNSVSPYSLTLLNHIDMIKESIAITIAIAETMER